ncbi:hypothetical protein [Candidatus Nanohalobium constans]|uniref:Uncharacterized protein n=1 Tax=Candidatus Nanohalobium constans TaxID=2565781 RepID=A0A5Q0UF24_9ARCH|nr:hypothetical protein [Candidatus Nanohalobium constans]QGA79951.1 hypothetical protein LC1Nh_0043 [Candidatus Nanohalobium constans]
MTHEEINGSQWSLSVDFRRAMDDHFRKLFEDAARSDGVNPSDYGRGSCFRSAHNSRGFESVVQAASEVLHGGVGVDHSLSEGYKNGLPSVVDLGSGIGSVVFAFAELGCDAKGIERDDLLHKRAIEAYNEISEGDDMCLVGDVTLVKGDVLEEGSSCLSKYDMAVANLPYSSEHSLDAIDVFEILDGLEHSERPDYLLMIDGGGIPEELNYNTVELNHSYVPVLWEKQEMIYDTDPQLRQIA